jgi:hypothetical protein
LKSTVGTIQNRLLIDGQIILGLKPVNEAFLGDGFRFGKAGAVFLRLFSPGDGVVSGRTAGDEGSGKSTRTMCL